MKTAIFKKLRNELTRELSDEVSLVSFKESNNGSEVVLVRDLINAIDTLIYSTDTSHEREDGYDQLIDGEPITLDSNEVFMFRCCDCGLTHNMVVATEVTQKIGFVVERIENEDN